jgi:ABC-type uncharacterized transport system YnjBCD substrate-binding protein
MQTRKFVPLLLALLLVGGLALAGGQREGAVEKPEQVKLVYMTAGDVNMLALGQNVIAPQLAEKYPEIAVLTVHTGPGNAGSQRIYEKVEAESRSKKENWDVDVAMVHQIFMKWAMEKDLLMSYAKDLSNWKYVTSPFAKNSLGVDIEGYAVPMFHSQTVLAYNPD